MNDIRIVMDNRGILVDNHLRPWRHYGLEEQVRMTGPDTNINARSLMRSRLSV